MSDWFDCTSSPYDYYDDANHLYWQPDSDTRPEPLTVGLSYDAVSDELLLELMPF